MCAKRVISASGSRLWIGRQTEWDVPVESYERQAIVDEFRLDRTPWTGGAVRRDERLTRVAMIREVCTGEACRGWYGLLHPVDSETGFTTESEKTFGFVTVCVQAPQASGPVQLVGLWPERMVLAAERGRTAVVEVQARCAREAAIEPVAGIGGENEVPLVTAAEAITAAGEPLRVVRIRLECEQQLTPVGYVCGVDTGIAEPRVLSRTWNVRMWIAARDADLRALESWQWLLTPTQEGGESLRVSGSQLSLVSSHERVIEDRVGVEANWSVGTVTMEWIDGSGV